MTDTAITGEVSGVGGVRTSYRIDGPEGAPWLIVSNSLATNLSMWDPQMAALGAQRCVLRYDQRGHGASAPADPSFTIDQLAGDVIALMDHLRIDSAEFLEAPENTDMLDGIRAMIRGTVPQEYEGVGRFLQGLDLLPRIPSIKSPALTSVAKTTRQHPSMLCKTWLINPIDVPFPEVTLDISVAYDGPREGAMEMVHKLRHHCAVSKMLKESGTRMVENWGLNGEKLTIS